MDLEHIKSMLKKRDVCGHAVLQPNYEAGAGAVGVTGSSHTGARSASKQAGNDQARQNEQYRGADGNV